MKSLLKPLLLAGLLLLFSIPAMAGSVRLQEFDNLGGDFILTDQFGKKFTLSEQKKVVMLFFGYLSCPDICPTTLLEMMQVKKALGADADQVLFVYVTVDPERDDQERLRTYLMNFDKDFVGLRGTPEEIAKVANLFKAKYSKRQQRSAMGYTVDHTAATYMIDQQGKLRYIFQANTPSNRMISGLRQLIKVSGKLPEEKSFFQKLFN